MKQTTIDECRPYYVVTNNEPNQHPNLPVLGTVDVPVESSEEVAHSNGFSSDTSNWCPHQYNKATRSLSSKVSARDSTTEHAAVTLKSGDMCANEFGPPTGGDEEFEPWSADDK